MKAEFCLSIKKMENTKLFMLLFTIKTPQNIFFQTCTFLKRVETNYPSDLPYKYDTFYHTLSISKEKIYIF